MAATGVAASHEMTAAAELHLHTEDLFHSHNYAIQICVSVSSQVPKAEALLGENATHFVEILGGLPEVSVSVCSGHTGKSV